MTPSQRTRLRSRWCVAGLLIAAGCVAFSPSLQAAVELEAFTDYSAFLSLLGNSAQVINFDDVPTVTYSDYPETYQYGYFDPNRYADQGILIRPRPAAVPVVLPTPDAVSPPNVYVASESGGLNFPPGPYESETFLYFTHDGQPALTSAFGAFFIGNVGVPSGPGGTELFSDSGLSASGTYSLLPPGITGDGFIPAGFTSYNGSTFLGLATVDSATGDLVPAINEIDVSTAGYLGPQTFLDNFTFASPVSPVPEGNVWALFAAAALAAVGLSRWRPAAPPKAARRSTI
jgi:hypothetical protein